MSKHYLAMVGRWTCSQGCRPTWDGRLACLLASKHTAAERIEPRGLYTLAGARGVVSRAKRHPIQPDSLSRTSYSRDLFTGNAWVLEIETDHGVRIDDEDAQVRAESLENASVKLAEAAQVALAEAKNPTPAKAKRKRKT